MHMFINVSAYSVLMCSCVVANVFFMLNTSTTAASVVRKVPVVSTSEAVVVNEIEDMRKKMNDIMEASKTSTPHPPLQLTRAKLLKLVKGYKYGNLMVRSFWNSKHKMWEVKMPCRVILTEQDKLFLRNLTTGDDIDDDNVLKVSQMEGRFHKGQGIVSMINDAGTICDCYGGRHVQCLDTCNVCKICIDQHAYLKDGAFFKIELSFVDEDVRYACEGKDGESLEDAFSRTKDFDELRPIGGKERSADDALFQVTRVDVAYAEESLREFRSRASDLHDKLTYMKDKVKDTVIDVRGFIPAAKERYSEGIAVVSVKKDAHEEKAILLAYSANIRKNDKKYCKVRYAANNVEEEIPMERIQKVYFELRRGETVRSTYYRQKGSGLKSLTRTLQRGEVKRIRSNGDVDVEFTNGKTQTFPAWWIKEICSDDSVTTSQFDWLPVSFRYSINDKSLGESFGEREKIILDNMLFVGDIVSTYFHVRNSGKKSDIVATGATVEKIFFSDVQVKFVDDTLQVVPKDWVMTLESRGKGSEADKVIREDMQDADSKKVKEEVLKFMNKLPPPSADAAHACTGNSTTDVGDLASFQGQWVSRAELLCDRGLVLDDKAGVSSNHRESCSTHQSCCGHHASCPAHSSHDFASSFYRSIVHSLGHAGVQKHLKGAIDVELKDFVDESLKNQRLKVAGLDIKLFEDQDENGSKEVESPHMSVLWGKSEAHVIEYLQDKLRVDSKVKEHHSDDDVVSDTIHHTAHAVAQSLNIIIEVYFMSINGSVLCDSYYPTEKTSATVVRLWRDGSHVFSSLMQSLNSFEKKIDVSNSDIQSRLVSSMFATSYRQVLNPDSDSSTSCEISRYGCCADGKRLRKDTFGSNCDRTNTNSCQKLIQGCCDDGLTQRTDAYGTECPAIEILSVHLGFASQATMDNFRHEFRLGVNFNDIEKLKKWKAHVKAMGANGAEKDDLFAISETIHVREAPKMIIEKSGTELKGGNKSEIDNDTTSRLIANMIETDRKPFMLNNIITNEDNSFKLIFNSKINKAELDVSTTHAEDAKRMLENCSDEEGDKTLVKVLQDLKIQESKYIIVNTVVRCVETEFGCCPDGVSTRTSKEDKCSVVEKPNCQDTPFGCCLDLRTMRHDEEGSNCNDDAIITEINKPTSDKMQQEEISDDSETSPSMEDEGSTISDSDMRSSEEDESAEISWSSSSESGTSEYYTSERSVHSDADEHTDYEETSASSNRDDRNLSENNVALSGPGTGDVYSLAVDMCPPLVKDITWSSAMDLVQTFEADTKSDPREMYWSVKEGNADPSLLHTKLRSARTKAEIVELFHFGKMRDSVGRLTTEDAFLHAAGLDTSKYQKVLPDLNDFYDPQSGEHAVPIKTSDNKTVVLISSERKSQLDFIREHEKPVQLANLEHFNQFLGFMRDMNHELLRTGPHAETLLETLSVGQTEPGRFLRMFSSMNDYSAAVTGEVSLVPKNVPVSTWTSVVHETWRASRRSQISSETDRLGSGRLLPGSSSHIFR